MAVVAVGFPAHTQTACKQRHAHRPDLEQVSLPPRQPGRPLQLRLRSAQVGGASDSGVVRGVGKRKGCLYFTNDTKMQGETYNDRFKSEGVI